MRRQLVTISALAISISAGFALPAIAAECVAIQDAALLNSAGETITPGYNDSGYNYQARIYNGEYPGFPDVDLVMKWNDAWLSNKDCDGDGKLDRHLGYDTFIGSGAWLTNHQSGKVDVNGKMRKWTYFVKIVAAGDTDYKENGNWYTADGIEVGPVIWNEFAIVEEVSNDPSEGVHGVLYKAPNGPGLGNL